MRALLAYAVLLLMALPLAVQPAMAFTEESIPFITTCDTIFMEPLVTCDATIAEFNSVNTAATSLETLDIDFPAFADGLRLGPTVVSDTGRASFNVVPFGPVNLAFPAISQTADETYAYQRTYFFIDVGAA